jgi:hypothetical protein
MSDKHRLVALLGICLGFASLVLTVFAFVYVRTRHPSFHRQDHRGMRKFSLY